METETKTGTHGGRVFRAIRRDARAWWYHAELRQQGRVEEARKREHRSQRSKVAGLRHAIRNGGYLTIGYTGSASLAIGPTGPNTRSSAQGLHAGHREAAELLLPVFRFDLARWEDASRVSVRGPMVVPDVEDPNPEAPASAAWTAGSFEFVGRSRWIPYARANGVPVQMPGDPEPTTAPRSDPEAEEAEAEALDLFAGGGA